MLVVIEGGQVRELLVADIRDRREETPVPRGRTEVLDPFSQLLPILRRQWIDQESRAISQNDRVALVHATDLALSGLRHMPAELLDA
jgi:hypothetical protein